MKVHRVASISLLIFGFALFSQGVTGQSVPVAVLAPQPTDTAPVLAPSPTRSASPALVYTRPTEREKVRLFEFDAFGPYAFAKAALSGGIDQSTSSPPEWGSGWEGFGKRTGSDFGIQLVTVTSRYGMAEIFREDTAYYRCECKGFLPRLGHALISTVTGRRGEDGHTAFSISGLVSPYAGTMTALAWYPDRFGVQDGLRMGNYNLLSQAAENVALEFIYGGPHTLLRNFHGPK